ncbi:MAG: YgaP family membrane protein [Bacteroidia bacterium]
MKNFVKFMVSKGGRVLRIVVGLIIIAIGAFSFTKVNFTLIIIGIIPLAAGLFDFCLLAPLMGYYFSGKKTRSQVNNT